MRKFFVLEIFQLCSKQLCSEFGFEKFVVNLALKKKRNQERIQLRNLKMSREPNTLYVRILSLNIWYLPFNNIQNI